VSKKIQFIRTTRDLEFEDFTGRSTRLLKGVSGYIITPEHISNLFGASDEKKIKMHGELDESLQRGLAYALVVGYPCMLNERDFVKLNKEPFHCVGELL
jgi:hypothetical protein